MLKYVTDYIEYWEGNSTMQKGYFFPIKLTGSGTTLKTNVSGTEKTQNFPDDNTLVIRIPSNKTIVKITVDETEVVTLKFDKAKLQAKT